MRSANGCSRGNASRRPGSRGGEGARGSMSRSLEMTASGMDSAVHAALGAHASAGARVAGERLPSVASRRMPVAVMRSLSGTLRATPSGGGGSSPFAPFSPDGDSSRPTSRASSRHSFEGLGQHSVWEPSPGGAASWERKQVAAFDRSGSSFRRPSSSASAARRKDAEKLGGKAGHPLGALTNPVPADVQAEVRRLDQLVQAAERRRADATLKLAELQDFALAQRHTLLTEVEATEEEDVRVVFDGIDLDGNGTLERGELDTLAQRLLHRPLSKKELDQCMKDMDEDGSGEVDFEEFLVWWRVERGKENSSWSGIFGDVLDGSNEMVKLKMKIERMKEELAESTRDAGPLIDELQRLLAVAGWHFRAQADSELRAAPPGWRQTYHDGPADDSMGARSDFGRDEFLREQAGLGGGTSRRTVAHSRRKGRRKGSRLKGNLRPTSAASVESMAPIQLQQSMQDTSNAGHRLGMTRRPQLEEDADGVAELKQLKGWQARSPIKDHVWTVLYPADSLVKGEEAQGKDDKHAVWSVRDVWNV